MLNARDHTSDSDPEYLGPIEVYANGEHVVTFSAIDTDLLYEQWLTDMLTSGYSLPVRPHGSGTDRSQRDLDVLLSMHAAGVPLGTTQAALEAGSDKALDRGQPYVTHLLTTVWGEP